MGVNVSLRQFEQPEFVDLVARVLAETDLSPAMLELEITERVIMRNETQALDALKRLHQLGIRLAVDDFGTGYSSLNYLKRLPIHRLKIDKSFVDDLPADHDDAVICRAIISLGQALALEIIAEGVENDAQRGFLLNEGCQLGQGYHFWRPLPAEEIAQTFTPGA